MRGRKIMSFSLAMEKLRINKKALWFLIKSGKLKYVGAQCVECQGVEDILKEQEAYKGKFCE